MTNQEAFDKVREHFEAQVIPATDGNGKCRYRAFRSVNEVDLMCGVGCLIPDSEYKLEFNGKGVIAIMHQVPALKGLSDSMLAKIQNIHDSAAEDDEELTSRQVKKQMEELANEYNLNY